MSVNAFPADVEHVISHIVIRPMAAYALIWTVQLMFHDVEFGGQYIIIVIVVITIMCLKIPDLVMGRK